MDTLPQDVADVAVEDVGAMMSSRGRLLKRSRRASDPFADRGRLRREMTKEPPIPSEICFTPDLLCKSVPNDGTLLSSGLLQSIRAEEDTLRSDTDELVRLEELCSSSHAENQSSSDVGSAALLEELFAAEEDEPPRQRVARAQFEKSDAAIIPEPGEDQPRASIVETENEELVALKAKCARLQSELEEERDRADNKEAAFAMLARKYDQTLNEKSRLQEKFLNLQTENNQQSLHMRILTREIELLKRGCQHRPSFSSESPTIGKIARRKSVEELRSHSIADQPASLERQYRRRVSVDVIERELAVLRGLDGERLDSWASEPPPRSNSIHARMRRLTSQASNVSTSNISEMTNPRSSAYNPRRDASSLRDSLRSYDFSRSDSDNKSTSHSFRNSRVSWHNSKDSLTVDLSQDDGRSYDARYLESQNTVNFGTSLEGDDFTDDLLSNNKSQNSTSRTSTFQANSNSSRPGIDKMDSLRTLRASNTLTASMTEYSFQPSVVTGSNDTSVRSRVGSQDISENTDFRGSKECNDVST